MEKTFFDPSTHRVVEYKGKPVSVPLMVYWKLNDMQPDETVIIQGLAKNSLETIASLVQKVKVSELSGLPAK